MTLTLTADEHQLLRELARDTGDLIAHPHYTVDRWHDSHASGCSPWSKTEPDSDFRHNMATGRAVSGEWGRRHVVDTYPLILADPRLAGHPSRFRFDDPHRSARITHARCIRWAESLPLHLRYRAAFHSASRNYRWWYRSLVQVAHDALDVTPVKSEAPTQLDLFGVA